MWLPSPKIKSSAKLAQQSFQLIVWPAQFRDLNPNENLLAILKSRLGKYQTAPGIEDEQWQRVQYESNQIRDNFIHTLAENMPYVLKIKNCGLNTKST